MESLKPLKKKRQKKKIGDHRPFVRNPNRCKMVRKEEAEVFAWFRTLRPSRRVELMHGLLNMCLPLELRFLGTCLESLCQKDYAYLRDCEHRANTESTTAAASDPAESVLDPALARSRLLVHLALLRATNAACANALFRSVLERTSSPPPSSSSDNGHGGSPVDDGGGEEHLLLLTFAFYHPAFTFEQKDVLCARLRAAQQKHCQQLAAEEETNRCPEPDCRGFQRGACSGNDVGDTHCMSSSSSSSGNSSSSSGSGIGGVAGPAQACSSPVACVADKSPVRHVVVTSAASAGTTTTTTASSSSQTLAAGERVPPTAVASSDNAAATSRVNATSTRSPSLGNVLLKAHIKLLELKSTHRRKGDKRLDYRIQVTWANSEVTEITKSHQELCNFHQQLLHFLQDDTNVHRQERHVPYFTGPKHMIGNRNEELTEDSVCRMADYLRQLMVKVPQHILNSNLVMGFFGASLELQDGSGAASVVTQEVASGNGGQHSSKHGVAGNSPFSSPTASSTTATAAAPHIMSHIQQQTSNFSSSSSFSSTSSASSPPPASSVRPDNNEREPTCGSSQSQRDVSPPSQQLKSMTIYNSLHGETQQVSAPQMTTATAGTTALAPTSSSARQLQRRQSSKSTQSTAYGTRSLIENDEGIHLMFRKDNLKRFWEQLRKKYSVRELLYLSEENLKNEGISHQHAKQIMKIFDVVRGQSHNGVAVRQPLLETPVMCCANSVQPSSASPPLQLTQTGGIQSSCCTVHTCQTQVYMPTAPLDHLVRCSVPVSSSDSAKVMLHSFPPTLPPPPVIQLPPTACTPCNGVVEFENLVSHSDVQQNAPGDKVSDASKEARFRRSGRNSSGSVTSVMHVLARPTVKHEENSNSSRVVVQGGDVDLVASSNCAVIEEFLQSTVAAANIPSVGYSVYPPALNSLPDESNQQPPSSSAANPARKLSAASFSMQQQQQQHHQQQPLAQVSLALAGLNVPPQRVPPPPRGHLCQNCPCTRTQPTPPPVATTPTLPYSFMPFPIGGVFSPFQTASGPTFLSPNSNGFVPTPTIPPPSYQFIHSPDGLVQAEIAATYSTMSSVISQQQQSGSSSGVQSRLPLPPPPTVPGFVAGPTPNVGFHGAHLQSPPPPTGVPPPPNGGCISLVGIGPPPPPPNSNLMSKWSCYNCGQAGHLGADCPEASFDDVNKAGQFQLSFLSSEKPLDDFD